jgi:hypothetical protein
MPKPLTQVQLYHRLSAVVDSQPLLPSVSAVLALLSFLAGAASTMPAVREALLNGLRKIVSRLENS